MCRFRWEVEEPAEREGMVKGEARAETAVMVALEPLIPERR
jgi:hypothetical protein